MKPNTSGSSCRGRSIARDLARAAWGIASLAAFGLALMCARPAPPPARPVLKPPDAASSRGGVDRRLARREGTSSQVSVQSQGGAESEALSGPLAEFHRGLERLASGESDRVRVVWFGDSHTAADYWTGSVRRRLHARSGNGGPGFVHIGLPGYQHGMVRVEAFGRWHGEPRAPSSRTLQHDGVFGLSGMRVRAEPGARAVLRIVDPPAVNVKWSIGVRFKDAGSRLSAELGDERRTFGRVDPIGAMALRTEVISGPADAPLVLVVERGEVELFGAVAEYDHPGLILDVLGINGARAETALAWSEQPWVEQLRQRAPTLVVLAYGTNEVFDALKPERYEAHFTELLRRIRVAVDGADCLIVGPTDVARNGAESDQRAEAIDRVEHQVAQRFGCAYFSAFEAMGGAPGFESWRASQPQLATADGVHLTRAGYSVLGDRLADLLLND